MAGPLSKKDWRPPRKSSVADLRHRVTIQRLDESVRDASGQVAPTWVAVATVWARVEPVTGLELFASQHVQGHTTHRVVMRHRTDVIPKMRLVWVTNGNKVLNVTSVMPTVGMQNSLELMCVEEI